MPMASTPMSSLVEHALSMLTLEQIETPEKAREIRGSLDRWRLQSAEHDSAYQEAVRQSCTLDAVAPALRGRFEKPRKRRSPAVRNRLLSFAFIAVAVTGLVAGMLEWRDRQPVFHRQVATGAAQVGSVELPDGGRIDLGARTTLEVTYFRKRRVVDFSSGEARFDVVHDASRPFSVQTGEGRVEVTGTIFSLADRGKGVSVALEQGRVLFVPGSAASESIPLQPGQRLVMKHGSAGPLQAVPPGNMAAWRRGWLVFEGEPLSEALPQINAYRRVPILADDPAVLQLRLTGSFRIAESEALLEVLPQILPVIVREDEDAGPRLVLRR